MSFCLLGWFSVHFSVIHPHTLTRYLSLLSPSKHSGVSPPGASSRASVLLPGDWGPAVSLAWALHPPTTGSQSPPLGLFLPLFSKKGAWKIVFETLHV